MTLPLYRPLSVQSSPVTLRGSGVQLYSAAPPFLGSAFHATLCKFEIRHGCSMKTM